MKSLIGLLLIVSSVAWAGELANKTLITDPANTFSTCVAQAAISEVVAKSPFYQGFQFQKFLGPAIPSDPYSSSQSTADILILAGTGSENHVFDVILVSDDHANGWQFVDPNHGSNGVFSTSVDTRAHVKDGSYSAGQVDISTCN
jgi:hypothetical protein